MKVNASSFFRIYVFITGLNTLVFSLLYVFFPQLRKGFVSEDQLIENASAFLGFASFLLGVIFLATQDAKVRRKVDAIVPILGLIGFLDEISFGERIFHIHMPMVYGVKIDAFHDFVFLLYKLVKSSELALLIFVIVAAVGVWQAWRSLREGGLQRRVDFLMNHPPLQYVCVACLFVFVATVLDLGLVHRQVAIFVEELFEMNAGLTLLFGALSMKLCRDKT